MKKAIPIAIFAFMLLVGLGEVSAQYKITRKSTTTQTNKKPKAKTTQNTKNTTSKTYPKFTVATILKKDLAPWPNFGKRLEQNGFKLKSKVNTTDVLDDSVTTVPVIDYTYKRDNILVSFYYYPQFNEINWILIEFPTIEARKRFLKGLPSYASDPSVVYDWDENGTDLLNTPIGTVQIEIEGKKIILLYL